jgi:hypothetical protein
MTLLVPDSNFTGAGVNDYVYLYSKMGSVAGAGANSGFEEWAVRSTGVVTPPPTGQPLSSLAGSVYFDANGNGVLDSNESGIQGVAIHLRGVDANGNTVDLVTQTDAAGGYKFAGLLAGTYTIWEEQPDAVTVNGVNYELEDGDETVGTLGGTTTPPASLDPALTSNTNFDTSDAIYGIVVGEGQDGVNYNFGEQSSSGSSF